MPDPGSDYALEFLLPFDGRIHLLAGGYSIRFEVVRVPATAARPHGLSYSLTLHAPDGTRLVGFDNAHSVPALGGRFRRRSPVGDHWHRTEDDPGRPYPFASVEMLLEDFRREVERVLGERGIDPTGVAVEARRPE
jgi:Family of unknown function (DUF6516)